MNRNHAINNIADLGDLNNIKLSDLAIRFRTGQAVANGIGRAKYWSYRHGISCALGDVESDMWMSAAAIKVIRVFGAEYFDQVKAFVHKYGLPTERSSDREKQIYALDICLSQLWNNEEWVLRDDFIKMVGLPAKEG